MTAKVAATAPEFISLKHAAAQLSVSTDYLRDRISRGELPAYRIGRGRGLIRIKTTDLVALARPIPTAGGVS